MGGKWGIILWGIQFLLLVILNYRVKVCGLTYNRLGQCDILFYKAVDLSVAWPSGYIVFVKGSKFWRLPFYSLVAWLSMHLNELKGKMTQSSSHYSVNKNSLEYLCYFLEVVTTITVCCAIKAGSGYCDGLLSCFIDIIYSMSWFVVVVNSELFCTNILISCFCCYIRELSLVKC